ncbi:MAG: hypothetical protein ACK5JN_06210 [Kluyvera sp.]|uniref:hypothetical protein n=1 Tax=Kluyvera sp. TaxID=1538228 RepID=UPI003A87E488
MKKPVNAITKPQWKGIEETLKSGIRVKFKYQGKEVEVAKYPTSETRMQYVVIVDNSPLLGFAKNDSVHYNPLQDVFLRKRTVNPYASAVRRISKERGGKALPKRKENRWMTEERLDVVDTFFPTARTVVTHFRKIEGLELVPPRSGA